jgi:hypothetical protein
LKPDTQKKAENALLTTVSYTSADKVNQDITMSLMQSQTKVGPSVVAVAGAVAW